MKFLKFAIVWLLLALLCQSHADAKVVYVNTAAGAGGDGGSWPTACRFLHDALDLTEAGDEVWVAAGTYYPDDGATVTTGDRTASFALKQDVKLYGGFAGGEADVEQRNPVTNPTTLSGEIWNENLYWSLHVVTLTADATLDGFTVTKGNANGDSAPFNQGGGIYVPPTKKLIVRNCNLIGAIARSGGAIYSGSPSSVTATDCTFSNNSASSGGAIYTSTVTVTDCTFSDNKASDGGAIFTSSISATNCAFLNNAASQEGGSINSSSLTVVKCIFSANSASEGGAIYTSSVTATDCNFSNNKGSASGGAIYSYSSIITRNCAFVSNTGGSGGAIRSPGLVATNCFFSSNKASTGDGGAIYSYSSLKSVDCIFSNNSAASNGGAAYSSELILSNCVYSNNSAPRGGALYSPSSSSTLNATNCSLVNNASVSYGGAIFGYSLTVNNCTFLNNALSGSVKRGADIYGSGIVRVFSNIFWQTLPPGQDNLIYITNTGSLRNADVDFPSPLNQAINLIKGGMAGITAEAGAVVSLGDTAVKILSADPLFVNAANPVGADGIWGTPDDGLRLQAATPAIDLGLSMFLPVDAYDLDNDGNVAELVPVDLAGYDRIQRAALDLGAYEVGDSFQPIGIVVQPLDLTLLKYLEATFTVTASGYGLRYQWYRGNSGDTSQPIRGRSVFR